MKVNTQVCFDALGGPRKSNSFQEQSKEDHTWHGSCDLHNLPGCLHSLPQAEVEQDDDQQQVARVLPPGSLMLPTIVEEKHAVPRAGEAGFGEGHCFCTQNWN